MGWRREHDLRRAAARGGTTALCDLWRLVVHHAPDAGLGLHCLPASCGEGAGMTSDPHDDDDLIS